MELDTSCQWLQLQADDYCCTVSLQTLRKFPDSLLAGLADTAVTHGRDRLRLDMSPQVAAEVVSVLRLGEGYVPPEDTRLVAALQVTSSCCPYNTPHGRIEGLLATANTSCPCSLHASVSSVPHPPLPVTPPPAPTRLPGYPTSPAAASKAAPEPPIPLCAQVSTSSGCSPQQLVSSLKHSGTGTGHRHGAGSTTAGLMV